MGELILAKPAEEDAKPKATHNLYVLPAVMRAESDPLMCPELSMIHVQMIPDSSGKVVRRGGEINLVPHPVSVLVACVGPACAKWLRDELRPRGGACSIMVAAELALEEDRQATGRGRRDQ